jgi:signal transduction histidine kinase
MTPMRAEAVRTLYLQMRNSALSALVVTLYMAGTALPYTPWRIVAAWAAIQLAMQISREVLIAAWRRRAPPDAALQAWARAYTLYMVATGALWGVTIILFAHPDQPITVALTMCCLYAIAAGSTPANAYNPPGLYALVGFMFAPIVVRLLWTGRLEYVLLGVASGLYAVAMAAMCRVQAATLDEGFRIRFENRALLEAVTVQKAEAEDARHRAERASLAKSQFLAAASHDLRQPLYALSLFSASLETLKLDEDGRAVVGRIQDSVQAMEQLFDGLLDLSKLDAGVVQPRPAPVCIDALFDRLSQYFYPIAAARGIELRLRSDGEWVLSDPVLLEQVLANLVSNAIRYTASGGVLIAARRRAAGVRLEVWDTGIGIAGADLERIFEEFVQVGEPEGGAVRGLGLGLSIARRSAALIGATIEVASHPGRGSRFSLTQPVSLPALAPVEVRPAHLSQPWQGSLPVLIVDDDDNVRLALADLLGRWQVTFDATASAEAALSLLDQGKRYSLVLADYRLGQGLNGLDLLDAIAARHEGVCPSMALVTANFEPELIGAARDRGVLMMHKPVQAAQLRRMLGMQPEQQTAST